MCPDASHFTLWLTEYNTPYDACCHGIVEVLYQKKTQYQELLIVRSGAYGKALVLDGHWQSSMGDEFMYHEPLVHPAAVLHGSPQKVLILGGGEGAALREALKWRSVREAVMVDLDGEVVDACRQHLPEMHQGAFDDPRAQVVIADAFDYIDQMPHHWDVIVSDLTDPTEDGPSAALFTREYFEKCKNALAPGGFFVLQAGLAGPVEMAIHVRLAKTVANVFGNMYHYISQVPSWASPMGFVIGNETAVDMSRLEPERVDQLLDRHTDGNFRMFDGRALRGLMNPPRYLRDAVVADQGLFTLADPPRTL